VRHLGDRSAARVRRLGGWLLVGTLGLGVLTARAGAQSPWVAELQAIWTRYHEDPSRLFAIRDGLEEAIKKKRIPEARKELEAVLAERSPRSLADWTLKDVKEARQLLDSIKDRS